LRSKFKQMKIKALFIYIFLISLGHHLKSQEVFSWRESVQYAMKHNLTIQRYELFRERQELNVNSAKYAFLPSVYGSAGYNQSFGRSIDPETNDIINRDFYSNNYNINGSLTLFRGFVRTNRLKYESYILQYQQQSLEAQKMLVAFSVLDSYFNALFYAGMREISREQVAISQRSLEKTEKMLQLGQVSGSAVREIEAQLAQDSLTTIQFEVQWIQAIHSLKRQMNFPIADTLILKELEIQNDSILASTLNTENIMLHAKTNLPEIKMLENNLKASEKRLAQIRGYAFPELSMGSYWSSGYYETTTDQSGNTLSFNDQLKGNARKNIGISLSIPLFNRLNNYNNIQMAKVNYQLAKNEYETELTNIEYTIHENILDLQAAIKEFRAAAKNVAKQKLAFETAEMKKDKGLIDIIDYNEMKNQYAKSKAEQLRTSLQLFLKYKTIQYYLSGEIF
jgi:outer membrane protein